MSALLEGAIISVFDQAPTCIGYCLDAPNKIATRIKLVVLVIVIIFRSLFLLLTCLSLVL